MMNSNCVFSISFLIMISAGMSKTAPADEMAANSIESRNPINTCELRVDCREKGSKAYYINSMFKTNWMNAMRWCRHHQMDLVTISSLDELSSLVHEIRTKKLRESFLIGGTDQGEEHNFFWVANGKQVQMNNKLWWENQPDNFQQQEHCLELNAHFGYLFNDANCQTHTYFICQYENKNV